MVAGEEGGFHIFQGKAETDQCNIMKFSKDKRNILQLRTCTCPHSDTG